MAYLLAEYHENEILVAKKDIPEIYYEFETSTHRYYPDFFIPKDNLVIEIKSTYTHEVDVYRINTKLAAVQEKGLKHRLLVFDSSGCLVTL
jgi:hypothetical protein